MRRVFYLVAIASVLIISLSIAYYLVIFLPSKEKARQDIELLKIQAEQQDVEKQEAKERAVSECTASFLEALGELIKSGKHYTDEEIKTMTNYTIDICLKKKGYTD